MLDLERKLEIPLCMPAFDYMLTGYKICPNSTRKEILEIYQADILYRLHREGHWGHSQNTISFWITIGKTKKGFLFEALAEDGKNCLVINSESLYPFFAFQLKLFFRDVWKLNSFFGDCNAVFFLEVINRKKYKFVVFSTPVKQSKCHYYIIKAFITFMETALLSLQSKLDKAIMNKYLTALQDDIQV